MLESDARRRIVSSQPVQQKSRLPAGRRWQGRTGRSDAARSGQRRLDRRDPIPKD